MSELPKTRKWNVRRKSAFMDQVQTDLDLADAMRDELLARIGELEQQLILVSNRQDAIRAEQAEAALAEQQQWIDDLQAGGWVNFHETMREALAEHVESCPKHPLAKCKAALAERDRMLRLAVELLAGMVSDHGPRDVTEDEVLADLKARAEEGSKDE